MRRPVICTPHLALDFLEIQAVARGTRFAIELNHPEGAWVGAGEPILHVTGPLFHLVDLETVLLQKLGPPCVAAYNAYAMCAELPKVAFLAMDARHCAGAEMAEMMAYAASIGSAGSTVRAAEMFREVFPNEPMTVLIDYFGHETSDAVAVARRFPELAAAGRLAVRIDTPGGRYCEGLDPARSYEVIERHAPQSIRGYRSEEELRHLVGTGVSAAAIWLLRRTLDEAGFPGVKIVASSGFGPAKCRMMATANAPINVIGTGSYLPELWSETYATADIIAYDGVPMVKAGREFLLRKRSGDG